MNNLRSYIDPDQTPATTNSTFKTEKHEYEVSCSSCGESFFVTESMYLFAKQGLEAGLDNPFKCDECDEAYDQLSY